MVHTRSYKPLTAEEKFVKYSSQYGRAWEIVMKLDQGDYTTAEYTLDGKPTGKKFIRMKIGRFFADAELNNHEKENLICEELVEFVKWSKRLGKRKFRINALFFGDENPIEIEFL